MVALLPAQKMHTAKLAPTSVLESPHIRVGSTHPADRNVHSALDICPRLTDPSCAALGPETPNASDPGTTCGNALPAAPTPTPTPIQHSDTPTLAETHLFMHALHCSKAKPDDNVYLLRYFSSIPTFAHRTVLTTSLLLHDAEHNTIGAIMKTPHFEEWFESQPDEQVVFVGRRALPQNN